MERRSGAILSSCLTDEYAPHTGSSHISCKDWFFYGMSLFMDAFLIFLASLCLVGGVSTCPSRASLDKLTWPSLFSYFMTWDLYWSKDWIFLSQARAHLPKYFLMVIVLIVIPRYFVSWAWYCRWHGTTWCLTLRLILDLRLFGFICILKMNL